MFFRRLERFFLRRRFEVKRPKISLIIPFSSKDPIRQATFDWLLDYWRQELPHAEIVVGKSRSKIFNKAEAFNKAIRKSTGRVLVLLDADAYISGRTLEKCADDILENIHNHLWFVPYRHLFRLNQIVTEAIILSDPCDPFRLSCPPPDEFLFDHQDRAKYGHRYGAMCMIIPREAYNELGGFDERFRGWGGEDVAILRALDTLYGKHKTKKGCIFHLWHPIIGHDWKTRRWEGQEHNNPNEKLAYEYHKATRHPSKMRKILDDAQRHKRRKIW